MSTQPTSPLPPDRHLRRTGADYGTAFQSLLPTGQAWPRAPDSILARACNGLAGYWGYVDGRAADLLERESDPRKTNELLSDWERAWGLPDPCFPSATSIDDRQRMLLRYMTWQGGQSRQYFLDLMEFVGFEVNYNYVGEFSPFMAGISEVGDTRPRENYPHRNFRWYIGPAEQRFAWSVSQGTARLTWFRASSGQAGVDPHLMIGAPEELQCLLNRWKPAHTELVVDLSSLAFGDPMQGTP